MLQNFFLARRQQFFVEDLIVRRGGFLVLLGQLLGIRQLQEDFAAPRLRTRIACDKLIGAIGGLAERVERRFQCLRICRTIDGVGGAGLCLGNPQQRLIGEARLLVR